MIDPNSQCAYFERRALEERAAAERACDQRARQSHSELAERYSTAARGDGVLMAGDDRAQGAVLPSEFRILP